MMDQTTSIYPSVLTSVCALMTPSLLNCDFVMSVLH